MKGITERAAPGAAGGEEVISSLALVPGLDITDVDAHKREATLIPRHRSAGWGSPSSLAVLRPLPFPIFPPELKTLLVILLRILT